LQTKAIIVEDYQKECTIKAGRLSIYNVIIITVTHRQKTDKQNHTKDKKETEGQRELEHKHN